MTKEQLNLKIIEAKLDAFNAIWTSRGIDPKLMGHKTIADFAWYMIKETALANEKLLQEWEKENPDG